MLIALCIMGILLGFSIAANIIFFVAYVEQTKEVSRKKFEAERAKIGSEIEKQRRGIQEDI
jgi:hypothetical protein